MNLTTSDSWCARASKNSETCNINSLLPILEKHVLLTGLLHVIIISSTVVAVA